jgi:Trp operon repressor
MAIHHQAGVRARKASAASATEARGELAAIFASVSDPAAMERLFADLFTRAERHDLILRWRLLKMLHEGMPQRVIAGQLGISLCKITRGSRVLKQPDAVITGILRRVTSPKGK